jgi:hypothetical protein
MIEEIDLRDYANQPDEPTGWAVKRNGSISLRTASYRPEAAKINALVLFGGVPVWATGGMSDDQINTEYNAMCERMNDKFEVVRVQCIEAVI